MDVSLRCSACQVFLPFLLHGFPKCPLLLRPGELRHRTQQLSTSPTNDLCAFLAASLHALPYPQTGPCPTQPEPSILATTVLCQPPALLLRNVCLASPCSTVCLPCLLSARPSPLFANSASALIFECWFPSQPLFALAARVELCLDPFDAPLSAFTSSHCSAACPPLPVLLSPTIRELCTCVPLPPLRFVVDMYRAH